MIAGHREAREALETELPPVTLLLGPDHVGKKTLAKHLMTHHTRQVFDQTWMPRLTVEGAIYTQEIALRAPVGPLRVIVIVLRGASTEALNRLLKLLEEPPSTARFILVASREPIETIRSRASTWICGYLSDEEVATVLCEQGTEPALAMEQARAGGGQIRVAMGSAAQARTSVLRAIQATLTSDSALLSIALKNWSAEDSVMLTRWCEEKISSQWRIFSPSDTTADRRFAERLHTALGAHRAARPRLAALTALEAASVTER